MSTDTYATNMLGAFTTALAAGIDEEISGVGLRSLSAATALVTIRNHSDDSIEVLRRVLNLTHSGAVRLINGMEEDGLVERHRSPHDTRAVTVRLTAEGRNQAEQVLRARAAVTERVFAALTDEQQTVLTPILKMALQALTEGRDSARRICRLCDEGVCRPTGCPVELSAAE